MEIGVLLIAAIAIISTYIAMHPSIDPPQEIRNLSEVCPLEFNGGEFDYKDPI